jgi:outer membrane protein assembly factor BamB
MMMNRYRFALVCATTFVAACGSPLDGEVLWQFETKKTHKQWADFDEQRFYLCADDVYCLEKETGRLLWEFGTFGGHSSAPVISGERLFFQCGGLYALDAETGDVLWEFWTKNWATVSPVVGAGRVYASAGNRMYCVDVVTGKRLWSVKTGPLEKAPVLVGNRLFFNRGQKIFCLDTSNGKVQWQFKVGSDSFNKCLEKFGLDTSNAKVQGQFNVGSDRVQFASAGDYLLTVGSAGLVRAHRIETGEVQWQLNTNMSGVRLCVLSTGRVLISAGELYCLDLESGVPLWTFKKDKVVVSDAQGLGDYVFARTWKRGLFSFSIHDGNFIRQLKLPDGGRFLTDKKDAIFFQGGQSCEVNSFSVPLL